VGVVVVHMIDHPDKRAYELSIRDKRSLGETPVFDLVFTGSAWKNEYQKESVQELLQFIAA
jgi:hypothetical protein